MESGMPRIKKAVANRGTGQRPPITLLDLLALVVCTGFGFGLVALGVAPTYGAGTAIAAFGAWSRLRLPRRERRSSGEISFKSEKGNFQVKRTWHDPDEGREDQTANKDVRDLAE